MGTSRNSFIQEFLEEIYKTHADNLESYETDLS